ncbi:hypothetical protein [Wukongibacter sp. M2B1]|uniref:hypothetical protein n=1 Tax=Wukongibacter sp. M2B1 TaxID=3088895 RepID=UPI003D792831
MNRENQKINGIICEIVILLLEKKAIDISIKIDESEIKTTIEISCEKVAFDKDTLNNINKIMSTQRTLEIENLYWGLVGGIYSYGNLHMVGNMVDDVKTYYNDNKFKIILCRKK